MRERGVFYVQVPPGDSAKQAGWRAQPHSAQEAFRTVHQYTVECRSLRV